MKKINEISIAMKAENREERKLKPFEMPENCRFCYACCGNCTSYGTINFSGYCYHHEKWVSSSGGPCPDYNG